MEVLSRIQKRDVKMPTPEDRASKLRSPKQEDAWVKLRPTKILRLRRIRKLYLLDELGRRFCAWQNGQQNLEHRSDTAIEPIQRSIYRHNNNCEKQDEPTLLNIDRPQQH